ncbi:MAG: hypothetical protein ACYCO3_05510 [Mycobacteriales bacterium]
MGEPGPGERSEDGGLFEWEIVARAGKAAVGGNVVGAERTGEAGEADDAVSLAGEKANWGVARRRCVLVGQGETVCS